MAEQLGDLLLARIFLQTTELRRAETHACAALAVFEALGAAGARGLGRIYITLGTIHHYAGASEQANEAFHKGLGVLGSSGDIGAQINVHRSRSEVFLRCGDIARAESEVETGKLQATGLSEGSLLEFGRLVRERLDCAGARIAIAAGRANRAIALVKPLVNVFSELRTPAEELEARLALCEAGAQMGTPGWPEWAADIEARARELGFALWRADALRLLAVSGNLQAAEQGLAIAETLGVPDRIQWFKERLSIH